MQQRNTLVQNVFYAASVVRLYIADTIRRPTEYYVIVVSIIQLPKTQH